MNPIKFKISVFMICAMSAVLASCGLKPGSESEPSDPISRAVQNGSLNIPLSEISGNQCLNLEKYFEMVRKLPAETSMRKIATDFRLLSGNTLPRNFYSRLIAGNFLLEDATRSEIPDFPSMTQKGCETVAFTEEGSSETYKIISAKNESITFQNSWGGQTTVTWKSSTSVEFDHVSVVGDDLCDGSSRGKILVTHQISWGDSSIQAENIPEKTVSQNFLSLVTAAKGVSLNSLYSSPVVSEAPPLPLPADGEEPDGEEPEIEDPNPSEVEPVGLEVYPSGLQRVNSDRQLLASRLKQLQETPVRPDLLQCY